MELVDIVDENNKLTGQVEDRWVAYNKGLWRRTVSCWIMNEKGEVLLQKRTPNKKRNPNKWAKTGGQVDSGETVEEAIFREVKEELGIEISKEQIKVVDIYKSNDKNKRFGYNFIFVVNYKIKLYPNRLFLTILINSFLAFFSLHPIQVLSGCFFIMLPPLLYVLKYIFILFLRFLVLLHLLILLELLIIIP